MAGGRAEIPTPPSIAAVVVTFHPDGNFPARLARVRTQVNHVIVVDNGSDASARGMLETLSREGGIELIANAENLGVAHALNQGAARAAAGGYPWLLTLDQDTALHEDAVVKIAAALAACPFADHVGVAAANFMVECFGRPFAVDHGAAPFIETASAITSGSLLRLAAYCAAGPFRNDYFIDFIDNEYCLRLRGHGWRVIHTRAPAMDHAIGAPRRYRLFWMRPVSSNHSALRRYYITRNRLWTNVRYFRAEPRAVVADYYRILGEMFLFTMFEDRKAAKLWATLHGAWHAILGRGGKLQREPWSRL